MYITILIFFILLIFFYWQLYNLIFDINYLFYLFNSTDKEVGGMEEAHEGMVWSLAWHPMGHILASGSNDHTT